jgi:hypothetical protein
MSRLMDWPQKQQLGKGSINSRVARARWRA